MHYKSVAFATKENYFFMKKYFEVLQSVVLFENIDPDDYEKMLGCLNAQFSLYKKDSIIFLTEDTISSLGIVLSGAVQVVKEDYLGNRTILTELTAGEIFGEVFACAGVTKSPVTVLTVTGCEVLFIDYKKVITTCSSGCVFHARLIENMLKLLAGKNLMLNQKIEFLSKRTTREKLLSYFSVQRERAESDSFTIPFTRHELADFLCVDRSALSRELGKMRDEGLLAFKGNFFELA